LTDAELFKEGWVAEGEESGTKFNVDLKERVNIAK
jgi:hypothetical protein